MHALMVTLLTLFVVSAPAYAKREEPKKVAPVVKAGVRYGAPNTPSRVVMVEAWDEKTNKKLWERIVYEVKLTPSLEEDVQWDFITQLAIKGDNLLITTESHRQYRLNVKTRKVERIDTDDAAIQAVQADRQMTAGWVGEREPHRVNSAISRSTALSTGSTAVGSTTSGFSGGS